MSPSLPTVGGDVDLWGGELNSFLQVGHNPDGTLNSAALSPPVTSVPTSPAINVTTQGVTPTGVGGADQTAAINALLASSIAAAQANGTNYVELYFPPGVYPISGARTQGGATKGNAQLAIPIVGPTVQKVTLILRSGPGGGDTLPLWTQTAGQKSSGACFYTNTTGSYSGTFGSPSVWGGPTSEQGYGNSVANGGGSLFNNIHIVLDGISVCSSTTNPTMCAFDFRGCAQLTVRSAGAYCDASTLGSGGVGTILPTNSWVFGLAPPAQSNNDLNNIYSWSCEGYFTGIIISEHCVVTRVLVAYCNVGISISSQQYAHGNVIVYASSESNLNHLVWQTYTHCIVTTLDVERNAGTVFDGGPEISDGGSNNARGYVGYQITGGGFGEGTEPVVNGCAKLKINNIGRISATFNLSDGVVAIPATNTPLLNPYWKDAFVWITGGTVTAIQVSTGGIGLRQVGTTTPALVCVPSGATLQLTYSVAPTQWVWTLI